MEQVLRGTDIIGHRGRVDRDYVVKPYDFWRPDRFSMEQITALSAIHEGFAGLAGVQLSALLRAQVDVKLERVEQTSFGECIEPLTAGPNFLVVLTMADLPGASMLQVDPSLAFAMLDRLFGGQGEPGPVARDVTDIECSTLEKVVLHLVARLDEIWAPVANLAPRLAQIETNARFAQIVPPFEVVMLAVFRVEYAGAVHRMSLCVPWPTIEPVAGRLSLRRLYDRRRTPSAGEGGAALDRLRLDTEVVAPGGRLALGEIRKLRPGKLVPVDGLDSGACFLRAGGCRVLELRPGQSNHGRLAFAVSASPDPAARAFLATGAPDLADGLAELRQGLAGLAAQVDRLSGALAEGVKGLREAQERLADQVVFGASERPAPPPAGEEAAAEPFAGLAEFGPRALAQFLGYELPQLVALVLFYMDDALAAGVVEALSEEIQADVLRRLVRLDRVAPEVIAEVDRVLTRKLGFVAKDDSGNDTLRQAAGLLNLVPAATEKAIIESLEKSDPELCERIKQRLFLFDDIVLLRPDDLPLVLAGVDRQDLLLAMKATAAPARAVVFAALQAEERESLRLAMEGMGRVRLHDAEAAGRRIVERIRRLEDEGRLTIGRPE